MTKIQVLELGGAGASADSENVFIIFVAFFIYFKSLLVIVVLFLNYYLRPTLSYFRINLTLILNSAAFMLLKANVHQGFHIEG